MILVCLASKVSSSFNNKVLLTSSDGQSSGMRSNYIIFRTAVQVLALVGLFSNSLLLPQALPSSYECLPLSIFMFLSELPDKWLPCGLSYTLCFVWPSLSWPLVSPLLYPSSFKSFFFYLEKFRQFLFLENQTGHFNL